MAVDLQTGPDGAVYLIDWCDLQHCHNPAEEKWDRTNGRIYRVSWAKTYHPVKVNLGAKSDTELAQLQTHHNDWYSRAARQLLQERAATGKVSAEAVQSLTQLATKSQNYAHVLRGLWTLHVIGALDDATLNAALKHTDDRVRAWAIQLATEHMGKTRIANETLAQLAANDPSPTVRLALASAMPALSADACWKVGTALAAHGEDAADRFLPKMIWFGLGNVITGDFTRGFALADKTPLPTLADSIRWFAAANPQGRELLTERIAKDADDTAARELRILAFGMKNENAAPMPKAWPQVQKRFANASATELSALFGDKAIIAATRATLADAKAPIAQRSAAFDLLKRVGDAEATPIFATLLDLDQFRSAVIPLLSRSNDPATAIALIQRYAKFSTADQSAALNTLTSRAALAMPLLHALEDGKFDRNQIGSFQVRQLRNLRDPALDKLLDKTWGKVTESSAEMKATIARLQKTYQEAPLWVFDANAGRETFQQVCAVCHSMNGVGGKLGPDLAGSWRNGIPYFLENIVDPNAVVGENFQLHVVTKKDGTVLSGLLEQETSTALTLRTLTEPVIITKADIKDHQKLAQSLMPPGLLEAMPERKAIELLKFLTSKQ
jgi:putative heme-binding domain-containing protein